MQKISTNYENYMQIICKYNEILLHYFANYIRIGGLGNSQFET